MPGQINRACHKHPRILGKLPRDQATVAKARDANGEIGSRRDEIWEAVRHVH